MEEKQVTPCHVLECVPAPEGGLPGKMGSPQSERQPHSSRPPSPAATALGRGPPAGRSPPPAPDAAIFAIIT